MSKSFLFSAGSLILTTLLSTQAFALVCTGQQPDDPTSYFTISVAKGTQGNIATLSEFKRTEEGTKTGSILRFYPVQNQYGRVFEVGYGPLNFELLNRQSLNGPADYLGSSVSQTIDVHGSLRAVSVELVYEYPDKINEVRVLGPKGIYAPALFEVSVTCQP